MTHYHRGDYVKLTMREPTIPTSLNNNSSEFVYHLYVVASDAPQYYKDNCKTPWIIVVHDNDWERVGDNVSTRFVKKHEPEVIHRKETCCTS